MLSGSNLVKVIEIHKSAPYIFSMHITFVTNSSYLSSSSSPSQSPLLSSSTTSSPPSSSSTSPCILCQPAHLVLGELHHLCLPPLLVLLPVLLVHHHLELEISGELLNLSLKKLCTERSYASSHTNLRCRFRTLFFFKTWIVLVKGNDNYWNQQIWKELQGGHALGVTVELFQKKLCP